MRWPWRKQPSARPDACPVFPVKRFPLDDEALGSLSINDLHEWLASPFWGVLVAWLDEQIQLNREALERGTIAQETAGQAGMLYRTDEALRGGIIGMRFVRDLFPGQLEAEIADAQTKTVEQED